MCLEGTCGGGWLINARSHLVDSINANLTRVAGVGLHLSLTAFAYLFLSR
jgi:hypothetical protein